MSSTQHLHTFKHTCTQKTQHSKQLDITAASTSPQTFVTFRVVYYHSYELHISANIQSIFWAVAMQRRDQNFKQPACMYVYEGRVPSHADSEMD